MSEATKPVADRVRGAILKELNVKPEALADEAKLVDDLGADSLDVVEVIMEIEKEFDIDVPDEDLEPIKTVGALVAYVEQAIAAQG